MNTKQLESLEQSDAAKLVIGEYIKPEDLARELEISERSLARWHSLRTGPPRTTIGKVILYRRAAVTEWLRSREERQRVRSR
jgi:hypothetical protein